MTMLLGIVIGTLLGIILGIAATMMAYSDRARKVIYRIQGDSDIKEGYVCKETDTLIKIGNRYRKLLVSKDDVPSIPDNAQWLEKSKIEIIQRG